MPVTRSERKLCAWYSAGTTTPVDATDELESALLEAITEARSVWPEVEIPDAAYLAYLGERAGEGADQLSTVRKLRASDLFLACGCVRGDEVAHAAFSRLLNKAAVAALRRQGATDAAIDEIIQAVSEHLLVRADGPVPLASFAGRGSLKGWLRATVVRAYLNHLRGQREVPTEDERVFDRLSEDTGDPELAHLRDHYREQFKASFYAAMNALPDRDKNLLRHFYIDNLSLEDLARMHDVSRATAHRWLVRARALVADATEAALGQKLGAGESSVRSIPPPGPLRLQPDPSLPIRVVVDVRLATRRQVFTAEQYSAAYSCSEQSHQRTDDLVEVSNR